MSDIYRPLFVLVEAIEHEARRLLDHPPPRCMMSDVEAFLQRHHGDETLSIQRNAMDRSVVIGHRCKLCGRSHWLEVSELELESGPIGPHLVVVRKVEELLEMPCDVGLAAAERVG